MFSSRPDVFSSALRLRSFRKDLRKDGSAHDMGENAG